MKGLTIYVAGSPGISEAVIDNEQFTKFQSTSVIQLNINQTVVTLRLRNIHNGCSIHSFDIIYNQQ